MTNSKQTTAALPAANTTAVNNPSIADNEREDDRDYIAAFRVKRVKAARNTIQTCRLVYLAEKNLDQVEFEAFCQHIGGSPRSRKIQTLIDIGAHYQVLDEALHHQDQEALEFLHLVQTDITPRGALDCGPDDDFVQIWRRDA